MKNQTKIFSYLTLGLVFTVILLFLFNPFFIDLIVSLLKSTPLQSQQVYIIQDDWITQIVSFYKEFFRLIDTGQIGWTWNLLFGADFFATKSALYITGDMFAWLSYIINKAINFVPSTIFIITIIKFYISGFTFNAFLSKFKLKFSTRLLFSSLFVVTGWSLIFLEHPIFISFYCMSPLVLVGIEDILQRNKYSLFTFTSAILLTTNFYLTWSLCFYLLVYWTIRYAMINRFEIKHYLSKSFKTLGCFLVGLLIASVIWMPSLLFTMQSPRISNGAFIDYSFWSGTNVLSILLNFFIPVTKFDNSLYRDSWYYFNQIGIYCGVFTVLIIPQLIHSKLPKIEKKYYILLLFFILLSLSSPLVGKLFHFTYSLRYTYIFCFTLLLIASLVFDKLDRVNKRALLVTEGFIIIILIFLTFVIPTFLDYNLSDYPEISMLITCLVFSVMYTLLLLFKDKSKFILPILITLVLSEMTYQGHMAVKSYSLNEVVTADYLRNEQSVTTTYKLLRDYDPNFYRINLQTNESLIESDSANFGTYYNIPTLKTYDSVYNFNNYDFLNYLRQYPDTNWIFSISDVEAFKVLSAKYSIIEVNDVIDLAYYDYIGEELVLKGIPEGYRIYKHDGNYPLATTYNTFFGKDELSTMALNDGIYQHEITNILANNAVVDDELVDKLSIKYKNTSKISIDTTVYDDNNVQLTATLKDDSFLFISIPYSHGWDVKLNNEKVIPIITNGGFIALEVPKGNNQITLKYKTPYLLPSFAVSLLGICLLGIIVIKKKSPSTPLKKKKKI